MKNVEPSTDRRGRPRSFDRDAALDTAMRLFWTRGYEATSISALADAMGIAPPSLYAAFGDKKRLFAEAIERYEAGPGRFAAAALASDGDASEAVEAMLLAAAAAFTDPACPRGCMVVLSGAACGEAAEDVAADLRGRRQTSEQLIRSRILRGAEAGELDGAEAEELAGFYATVFQGLSIKARDGASRAELEAVARRAMLAWPVSRSRSAPG